MRKPVLAAIALLASSSLAACEQEPSASNERGGDPEERITSSLFDSILATGEELYWDGEFEAARDVWRPALAEAVATGDVAGESRLLTWLGLAAYRLGDYVEARRLGEAALMKKLQLEMRSELPVSYNALGLLAWNEGRLPEAVDLLRRASEAARVVADEEGVAKAQHNLGLVFVELGEFSRARKAFEESAEAGRSFGNGRLEGASYNNLGMLEIKLGDPLVGIRHLYEARRIYREIGYATGEQNTLGQLATGYAAIGQPAMAFALLDSAQEIARSQGLRQEEASNLEFIGQLYREAGDLGRALDYLQAANVLNEELGLEVERGTILRSQADIYTAFEEFDQARLYARQALAIHEHLGAHFEIVDDRRLLAEVESHAGRTAEARRHLHLAGKAAEAIGARLPRVDVGLAEARLADRERDHRGVLAVVDRLREDLQRGDYRARAEAERLRARAFAGLGVRDSAVAAGRRAVAALERMRSAYGSPILRSAFVTDRSLAYVELVENLLREGSIEEAFEVANAARGRALVEHLVSDSNGRSTVGGDAVQSLAEGEGLLRTIDALVALLDEVEAIAPEERVPADDETMRYLQQRLVEARGAYEFHLNRMTGRYPEAMVFLGGGTIETREVLAALGDGEVLISYLVTPERLLIFVATPEDVQSLSHEIDAVDLESRVRLVRDLVSRPEEPDDATAGVLRGLYDVMLGVVERSGALSGARTLIIAPHGFLNYVPFAALEDRVTGRYLFADFALVVLPSANALPATRHLATAARRDHAPGATVFLPFPDALPATSTEARAVARSLRDARVYQSEEATETRLKEALGDARIVHIASHALMNPRNPMFSRIELSTGGNDGSDGRLELHEIVGVRMSSPLIFLSGCETALGGTGATVFSGGEDYATLANAFLYAGAENVVATLWRIEDTGAAEFARRFYRHLRRASPPIALSRAQQDMLETEEYAAPYYWAGYRISGHGWPLQGAKPEAMSVRSKQDLSLNLEERR